MNDQEIFSKLKTPEVKQDTAGKVIKRVFHTRTEFRIYPNGEVYPEKTQSWFEDRIYFVKKKVKAKAKPIKKINTRKLEEY